MVEVANRARALAGSFRTRTRFRRYEAIHAVIDNELAVVFAGVLAVVQP
jgi:hypothetical protein